MRSSAFISKMSSAGRLAKIFSLPTHSSPQLSSLRHSHISMIRSPSTAEGGEGGARNARRVGRLCKGDLASKVLRLFRPTLNTSRWRDPTRRFAPPSPCYARWREISRIWSAIAVT